MRHGALYCFLQQSEDGKTRSGKAQAHEVRSHEADDQYQIQISSTLINRTGSVHIKRYSRQYCLSLIRLVVNDEVGELNNFLPPKRGVYLREETL